MDRLFLEDWGRGLSDEEFVQALAAAGTRSGGAWTWPYPIEPLRREGEVRLAWRLAPKDVALLAAPQEMVDRWRKRVSGQRPITLIVKLSKGAALGERWQFARMLAQVPDVSGVTLESPRNWVPATAWKLPMSIASLPEDPAAQALLAHNAGVPPNWPFRYVVADRQQDRHQIIVVSQPLDLAWAALQQSPVRTKCCVVVVNGMGNVPVAEAARTLDLIAARLSASGVVVAPNGLGPDGFATAVQQFAYELTHDLPVDAAMQVAFGREASLVGNVSLLQAARVSYQVRLLQTRLDEIPRDQPIRLSLRSIDRLTRGRPRMASFRPVDDFRGEPAGAMPPEDMGAAMAAAAREFDFAGESHEASALTELAGAVRDAAADAVAHTPATRFVQQQSYVQQADGAPLTRVFDAYAVAEPVVLKIRIGSGSDPEWQSSNAEFPFHELPPNASQHHLTVMFHEPRQLDQPLLADLDLPRVGSSTEAEFAFTPRVPGAFEARVSVLHRGRVLQTALLRATVLQARAATPTEHTIELVDEARVRQDWTSLDQRRRFDLALVCNHDDTQTPRMTGVSGGRAWATDLTGIEKVVARINALLTAVANNTDDYGDGLDQGENPQLLRDLAVAGRALRRKLVLDQLAPTATGDLDLGPDGVTHIQIVATRIDAVIPVEFIYDYEAATQADAPVCPEHRAALQRGACNPDCPGKKNPAGHVCPMGFWGVRMVIERHAFDARKVGSADPALLVTSESTSSRNLLNIRHGALVGYSDRVKKESVEPLLNVLHAQVQEGVYTAGSWTEWAGNVAAHSPQLLIAFPHNDESGLSATLEVGGDPMATDGMRVFREATTGAPGAVQWHVRPPQGDAPLVLLLGCDTAGTAETFVSHVSAFRQAGAAIVVSTIATVFGEHAVKVGTAITTEMLKRTTNAAVPDGQGADRFGEILREAKRQALLESLPMALCVVAFGDADWRL
jgi:hypothetical protein